MFSELRFIVNPDIRIRRYLPQGKVNLQSNIIGAGSFLSGSNLPFQNPFLFPLQLIHSPLNTLDGGMQSVYII